MVVGLSCVTSLTELLGQIVRSDRGPVVFRVDLLAPPGLWLVVDIRKRAVNASEGYERQIALINSGGGDAATEVSKLRFEIESGKLKDLNALEQAHLLNLAGELDAKIKLKKQNEEELQLATLAANLKGNNTIVRQGFEMELAGAGSGDKLKERLKEDLAIQQDYYNQLDEAQGDWMAGVGDAWSNYLDQSRDISGQTKDLFSDAFSGMNDALYNFVTTGKLSFSDMAATFASTALKMLIQWGTAQVAMAALNAFTSTAAIPLVGPFAAPAAAASALGSAGSFMGMISSVAGMAHDGIDLVPQDGTWLLQKGERVTTAETSAKLDRTLEQVSRGRRRWKRPDIQLQQ